MGKVFRKFRNLETGTDGTTLTFNLLNKPDEVAIQIELCRFVTACLESLIPDKALMKFKEKWHVRIEIPSDCQPSGTIFVPCVVTTIGEEDKIFTFLWDAEDVQRQSLADHPDERAVKRVIMTRGHQNSEFFGSKYLKIIGDANEGQTESFLYLFNELQDAFLAQSKPKSETTEGNSIWELVDEIFAALQDFWNKCKMAADFSENQLHYREQMARKILDCKDEARAYFSLLERTLRFSHYINTNQEMTDAGAIKGVLEVFSLLSKKYPDLYEIFCKVTDEYMCRLTEKQEKEELQKQAEDKKKEADANNLLIAQEVLDEDEKGAAALSDLEKVALRELNRRRAEQKLPPLDDLSEDLKRRLAKKVGLNPEGKGSDKGVDDNDSDKGSDNNTQNGNQSSTGKKGSNKSGQRQNGGGGQGRKPNSSNQGRSRNRGQQNPPRHQSAPAKANEPHLTGAEVVQTLINKGLAYGSGKIPKEFDANPGKSCHLSEVNKILKKSGLDRYLITENDLPQR